MKILFFSPSSLRFGGGGERWLLEVTQRLSRLGCKSEIVTTSFRLRDVGEDESLLRSFKGKGIEVVELPYIRPPIGLMLTRKSLVSLFKRMKNADVIYFMNSFVFQDMTIVLMRHMTGKPVINGVHQPDIISDNLYGYYCRSIGKEVMKGFSSHHVLNTYYERLFRAWGFRNIRLIPNGVDTDRFKPINYSRTRDDNFEVLFIGRLRLRKGIDLLHEAIIMLNRELKDNAIEFVIVGKGPCIHLVKSLENRYGNVRYISYVPSEYLPQIYSNAHLFVFPSRTESWGFVALEAQSSGLPVVASNIPGPRDFIRDGVTGSLISPEKPKVLAAYIKYYYKLWSNNCEKYLQICVKARENALKFDWNQVVKYMYQMLYVEAIKNKEKKPHRVA